jgi:LysR family transcriptional regulator, glycine cleavage system transcriptional activator
MHNLPLDLLNAFEAAGRTGSFRMASQELGVTPSAISHAIRKLESLIGSTLFEREGRRVRLNANGEAVFHHVTEALDHVRRGLEMAGARSDGLLRLHCAPSLAAQWLMPRLKRLFAELPGLKLRLSASADYPRFQHNEIDADICYGPPRQEGLVVIPLGEEVVCPLCSPELAAGISTPADLLRCDLLESDHKRVRWDAWFAVNEIELPTAQCSRFDRSFMAIAAAVDGLGIALESTRLAEREIACGQLVAPLAGVASDVRYIGHYLIFPPPMKFRRPVRLFASWLAKELRLPPPDL